MLLPRLPLIAALSLLAACAARTPGASPHDMGSADHEQAADAAERTAAAHAGQYDPEARRLVLCGGGKGSHPCWTNPTEAHAQAARRHREMAADHRAASAALREAEARSCAGLDPASVDLSPFEQAAMDIASVEPLPLPLGAAAPEVLGATVTVRAVEGLTAEWLQRAVDCHVARNAAVGHEMPEMPSCPLVPRRVTATVSSTGTGFAVAIRSDDPVAAADILARAKRLAPVQTGGAD